MHANVFERMSGTLVYAKGSALGSVFILWHNASYSSSGIEINFDPAAV